MTNLPLELELRVKQGIVKKFFNSKFNLQTEKYNFSTKHIIIIIKNKYKTSLKQISPIMHTTRKMNQTTIQTQSPQSILIQTDPLTFSPRTQSLPQPSRNPSTLNAVPSCSSVSLHTFASTEPKTAHLIRAPLPRGRRKNSALTPQAPPASSRSNPLDKGSSQKRNSNSHPPKQSRKIT